MMSLLFRYLWASPNTLIGLLLVPSAMLPRGGIQIINGVLEAHGPFISAVLRHCVPIPGGACAITFGHVVLARDSRSLDATRAHERVHVRQCEMWGPAFIPAYLLAGLWGLMTGRGAYTGNYFERQASESGHSGGKHRHCLFAILGSSSVLVFLAGVVVMAATMPAVKMTVVDAEDGKPIPGLVALFWGAAREGTITGHGGRHAILFAVEAVSDQSGELRFPKQDFRGQPFFLNTNYENPSMLLLKPGYLPLVLHNQLRAFPTLAEASKWEYEGHTVKMTRATEVEIRQQGYLITTYTNMMLGFDRECTWKRVPRALVVADRMFPDPGMTNTLRTLLLNDAVFVQQGCGSPKTFFDPYLPR